MSRSRPRQQHRGIKQLHMHHSRRVHSHSGLSCRRAATSARAAKCSELMKNKLLEEGGIFAVSVWIVSVAVKTDTNVWEGRIIGLVVLMTALY